jgi:hypothetical protein
VTDMNSLQIFVTQNSATIGYIAMFVALYFFTV